MEVRHMTRPDPQPSDAATDDGAATPGDGPSAPTPSEADERLAAIDHLDREVRLAGRQYARYLLGLGALSLLWFVALAWLAPSDTGVLVSGVTFGITLAALSLALLPRAQANRRGFTRRWLVSMGLWGLCFAVFLTAGLLWNREDTFYWLLTAPLVAGPAFIGAQVEGRA
jgi:peptidoglycan/LPS O-acetylase OafA/YrhL